MVNGQEKNGRIGLHGAEVGMSNLTKFCCRENFNEKLHEKLVRKLQTLQMEVCKVSIKYYVNIAMIIFI